jgi:lauroyl/myristoyl acyltransferase
LMEAAVRRDPANWFWVHNRWKPRRTANPQKNPRPDRDPTGAESLPLKH